MAYTMNLCCRNSRQFSMLSTQPVQGRSGWSFHLHVGEGVGGGVESQHGEDSEARLQLYINNACTCQF